MYLAPNSAENPPQCHPRMPFHRALPAGPGRLMVTFRAPFPLQQGDGYEVASVISEAPRAHGTAQYKHKYQPAFRAVGGRRPQLGPQVESIKVNPAAQFMGKVA